MAIVNERGEYVFADEPAFDLYACLSEAKIKELKEILIKARMPRDYKKKLTKELEIHDKKLQELFR